MWKLRAKMLIPALIVMGVSGGSVFAVDKGIHDPTRTDYYEKIKGKRVVFVPVAMGFDLTEGWNALMQRQARELGYTVEVRDPNWSTEAGIRALNSVIADKPDLLVIHNPDIQSYAKLLKKVQAAEIKVLAINLPSLTPADSFVGADFERIGEEEARILVEACGAGSKGPSHKVSLVLGVPTAAATIYTLRGFYNVMEKQPDIEIVSQQVAAYDPQKARSITATVLQQHPDLCGVWGTWENQDVGAGAAIAEASKTGQIRIVSLGGGNALTCENINKGLLTDVVSFDLPSQGAVLNQQITELLTSKAKPGEMVTMAYSPLTVINKTNNKGRNCWTPDELK